MIRKSASHIALSAAVLVLLIVLDQWTKSVAVRYLAGPNPAVLIPGVLELRYLENHGAAFSILQNQQLFFRILTFFIIGLLGWIYLFRLPQNHRYFPLNADVILLLAGAAGNLIDRMRQGYVVDFIYFRLIDFPIFNVADCYVSIGAVLFILLILFYYHDDEIGHVFIPARSKAEGSGEESHGENKESGSDELDLNPEKHDEIKESCGQVLDLNPEGSGTKEESRGKKQDMKQTESGKDGRV